jgi:hypothetical protein
MSNLEMYEKVVAHIASPNVAKLDEFLKSTDFFSAPASHAYHHSYEGGLLEHCLEVFKYLGDINKIYPEIELTDETRFILAFGHDLSKTNYYEKQVQNKKIHGEWRSVETYGVTDKLKLPHEEGSIHLLKKLFPIDIQIERAILYHHGAFNEQYLKRFSNSCAEDDYTFILHTADMVSTKRNERYILPKIRDGRGW